MKNALTIDVEDWYQTLDFNFDVKDWCNFEDRIINSTNTLLELLDQHDVKATFFILGCIAEKHPELVRDIASRGHEIGSHGMWHIMVTRQNRDEFKEDVIASKSIIEDIIGDKVILYRSSSWSVCEKTLWALEILDELGFICDSSIQPFKTPLSGMKSVGCKPFYPVINNKKLNILEYPSTVLELHNLRLPFAGGLYLRLLPYCFMSQALKIVNRTRPGMIYVHPWETDTEQPRLDFPLHIKAAHYINLKKTKIKLEKLLSDFEFAPIGEIIKNCTFETMNLK